MWFMKRWCLHVQRGLIKTSVSVNSWVGRPWGETVYEGLPPTLTIWDCISSAILGPSLTPHCLPKMPSRTLYGLSWDEGYRPARSLSAQEDWGSSSWPIIFVCLSSSLCSDALYPKGRTNSDGISMLVQFFVSQASFRWIEVLLGVSSHAPSSPASLVKRFSQADSEALKL